MQCCKKLAVIFSESLKKGELLEKLEDLFSKEDLEDLEDCLTPGHSHCDKCSYTHWDSCTLKKLDLLKTKGFWRSLNSLQWIKIQVVYNYPGQKESGMLQRSNPLSNSWLSLCLQRKESHCSNFITVFSIYIENYQCREKNFNSSVNKEILSPKYQ